MNLWPIERIARPTAPAGSAGDSAPQLRLTPNRLRILALALFAFTGGLPSASQNTTAHLPANALPHPQNLPPRVAQAQRFLARRGWAPNSGGLAHPGWRATASRPQTQSPGTAAWQPFGPTAVLTSGYGLVTGRVSALALDPSDSTGNRLYLGTTGGGVWAAGNAGAQKIATIGFNPLTDDLAALTDATGASISIGALAVQPGSTGVLLAGTGDPNDNLDSYYGAGILRSTDNGTTWSLIQLTADQQYAFVGEGFAGFAFSTANPQLVVAAVSQAYEGTLVNAERADLSYEGLYYSSDGGATWNLATITDGASDVQGPGDPLAAPDGNAATSVVWNPVRQVFFAAVRFHGYYQSTDGITFTRLANQPGSTLTTSFCPTNSGSIGSTACPIFRGALAVNPITGDTFAWTVDIDNQDQGLRQDQCAVNANTCNNPITFVQPWSTAPLESNTSLGAVTIENGDYNLALAAVPAAPGSGTDTLLLAGAHDLWRCSLAMGCVWRNTTNATTCMSAKVGEYQHSLAWNAANPLEIFVGNDSGLWRSTDGIAETGAVCASTDAAHFQNLNGTLGSLAEVESFAQPSTTPYTMMAGLGANGTAGVKGTSANPGHWPAILGGEGGPVAISPVVASDWYVNNQTGVSIYACTQTAACTPADFGATPVVTDADVGGDGLTMPTPAPFLVDPLDPTQLLVATCRVWRGTASGTGWTSSNAISPILDGGINTYCDGDALIRSMAAMPLAGGSEVIYVGMYGSANGGANLPGHVLSATLKGSGGAPVWKDLTLNPVTNDSNALNHYGLDISSIAIDSHDATGKTLYVTVAGFASPTAEVEVLYRSTDGGAHWAYLTSNLPPAPANSLVVDPQDANTVYLATDAGVFSTRQVASCATSGSTCWSAFGAGLPQAPVVALTAAPATASLHLLTAATYGRGVWMTPLWTASEYLTTATATPASLTFPGQVFGTASSPRAVTVKNTGSSALMPTSVAVTGDFSETDNCRNAILNEGESCAVQVTFTPTQTGTRAGQLTVGANLSGGQLTVALSGTGTPSGAVSLTPATVDFGLVGVGVTSAPLQVTATNTGSTAIPISAFNLAAPFFIASNACGASLAPDSACQLTVEFQPTVAGAATGTLTMTDTDGTQTVALSGTGAAPPTDTLSAIALNFPATIEGQLSAPKTVTLTNSGGLHLTAISVSVTSGYQTSNNCGGLLVAQSSCTISVIFAPNLVGLELGTLSVADALKTQTVALSGIGLLPPRFTVSPTALNFTGQLVGKASPPSILTVTNSGGAPMANVGFQLMGQSASSFSTGATTCGAILKNGSSCTVGVVFTPATTGGSAATLVISSSTGGVTPVSVPLSGNATAPGAIAVNPPQLAFPMVAPGQSSAAQGVYITNTGAARLTQVNLAVAAPFSLAGNTCAGSLGAGSSCSTGVVFSPAVDGNFTGALTVSSPSLATTATVTLSGIGGVPGSVQAQPGLLSFPITGLGIVSSPATVTLTNPTQTTSLTSFTLAATGPFKVAATTCTATLAPLASCTVQVVFAPLSAGQQTGSLTVSSAAMAASAAVQLEGVGFDFTVAPSGAGSQTVSSGQTAYFPLAISLIDQTRPAVVTLSCNTASPFPPYATCVFNPSATPSVPAAATGNATVEVVTGQAQSSARAAGLPGWRLIPLSCGLLLLPLALGRRRKTLLLAALLAVLASGVTSCTASGGTVGSGTPRTGPGTTPAATYSIPVTVTSNGVQHSLTLTLIVD